MSDKWLTMSACDLGRGIGMGEIDALALTQTYLGAIEASPVSGQIYARTTPERALAEAVAARERAMNGVRRGLLDGVPISWKDLYDSAGVATESGSKLLEGRVPRADALVLARATRAGLVCLGKTHQTELAFSGLGVNPVTATPPNVNDPSLAPGGSSSGAATSVAHGLAAAGIGSDTGGSVRIPAAWNNLVGMKTSHGLLPLDGVVPLCAAFDTVGPLTRSVEDAAHLVAIMAGTRAPDLSRTDPRSLRILVSESVIMEDADNATLEAFAESLEALQSAGVRLERSKSPSSMRLYRLHRRFLPRKPMQRGTTIEANPDVMHPPVRDRFRAGAGVSGSEFVRAWAQLNDLRAAFAQRIAGFDGVLLPTTPLVPPKTQELLQDDDLFSSINLLALRNTRLINLMGGCALTLPTPRAACGAMLAGGAGADTAILRVGAAIAPVIAKAGGGS